MVAVEQRPALVCQRCDRAFAGPGGLGSHRLGHERADAAEPRPGWRIEAGAGGGWLWALSWRWRPDGGNCLDGVPQRLVSDLYTRCYRAKVDPADPPAVLSVAIVLLASRGIAVEAVEELPAPPGPTAAALPAPPPAPPVIRPRARPRRRRPPRPPAPPPPAPAPSLRPVLSGCACGACAGPAALWPSWDCGRARSA